MNKEKLMENWDKLKDETKTKILALADKEVKDDYFVPKEGEVYYYYELDCTAIPSRPLRCCNSFVDEYNIKIGNIFKTAKEAMFAGDCEYYTKRFETYVNRHTDKLDWNDKWQPKYYAYDKKDYKEVWFCNDYITKVQGVIYASSIEILKDAIADIGEDNFLKYVLKMVE